MRKTTRTIQAELIEYTCDSCRKGVYRITDNHPEHQPEWQEEKVLVTWPTLWTMKCNTCGDQSKIAQPYPVLRYKLNDFILQKHSASKIEALRRLLRIIIRKP
jgi:hypothetical protein